MIYFIYRYHTNFLDIHLQSCFLPNCSNFDLKLQLKISIGLSTLLWDTIWIHIQNCCFNSPFVGFQNRCLPGLLFFLVSFFCTLFDLWMCSVYNALGSEWLKWKQCKPTQLAKPCLIGKISCFFIMTLFISSEKELYFIHAKGDATKNLAVLCAKMASSLMCGRKLPPTETLI